MKRLYTKHDCHIIKASDKVEIKYLLKVKKTPQIHRKTDRYENKHWEYNQVRD